MLCFFGCNQQRDHIIIIVRFGCGLFVSHFILSFIYYYYLYIICTGLVQFDINKKSEIIDNYAGLHRLVEISLPNFTIEMFQA